MSSLGSELSTVLKTLLIDSGQVVEKDNGMMASPPIPIAKSQALEDNSDLTMSTSTPKQFFHGLKMKATYLHFSRQTVGRIMSSLAINLQTSSVVNSDSFSFLVFNSKRTGISEDVLVVKYVNVFR